MNILHYSRVDDRFFLIPQHRTSCGNFCEIIFSIKIDLILEWENYSRSKRASKTKTALVSPPSYYSEYLDGISRYVELVLVADNSFYKKYGSDEKKVYDRLQSIASVVNSVRIQF